MAEENEYLIIVNPKTGESHAVTEEGFIIAEHGENGFKVDKYQNGIEYTGSLPKLSAREREENGLRPPTPYAKTAAGHQEAETAKRDRAEERAMEREAAHAAAAARQEQPSGPSAQE